MKEKLSVCGETAVSYEQEHICTGLVLVGFSVYKRGTCILWFNWLSGTEMMRIVIVLWALSE